jgi:hypothetical protein
MTPLSFLFWALAVVGVILVVGVAVAGVIGGIHGLKEFLRSDVSKQDEAVGRSIRLGMEQGARERAARQAGTDLGHLDQV